MIIKLLWVLNTIIWGTCFALLIKWLGYHGFYAGYAVGAFYMMLYYGGISVLEDLP
jgi:hypothetical protein